MEDSVTTTIMTMRGDSIISKYMIPDGGLLSVGINGMLPLANKPFDIDSINNLIINLTLDKRDSHSSLFGPGTVDGGDYIEVKFSPIPYVRLGKYYKHSAWPLCVPISL